MEERRVLVVANRTLCEPSLLATLVDSAAHGPVRFHVLVPSSHPSGAWTDWDAEHGASDRLEAILVAMREHGLEADGSIGDASPVTAVADLQRTTGMWFDEMVVSTLPTGVSKWLAGNVVKRLRAFGMPVTHVVAGEVPAPA